MEVTKFTGNKDVDMIIFGILDDRELTIACQINKYTKELCKNDLFWKKRFDKKFGKILTSEEVKVNKGDWEKFYKEFIQSLNSLNSYFYTSYDRFYSREIKLFRTNCEEEKFYIELLTNPLMTKYFTRLAKIPKSEYVRLYERFSSPTSINSYVTYLYHRGLNEKNAYGSYHIINQEYYN